MGHGEARRGLFFADKAGHCIILGAHLLGAAHALNIGVPDRHEGVVWNCLLLFQLLE